jgi:magnesium transporter
MHKLTVCRGQGEFLTDVPVSAIPDLRQERDTALWLDITCPDKADVALLHEAFGLHPLAVEDILHETQRPKIDVYNDYYLIVFYTARFAREDSRIIMHELDLVVGHNFVVSVHDEPMPQIDETIARWHAPDSPIESHVASLLYWLLDTIVDDYFPLIDAIAEQVEDLEDQIFIHSDDSAIETIFRLKKELLTLRRIVAPERDVLNVLLRREVVVFDVAHTIYLQDLYDHILRVTDSIDTYRDLLSSALDSFLSLQSNRLNQIVKVLTIASIVLMSASLVAGIYGMNFESMPELHWRYGYPFALGLMLAISGGLLLLFRRMKWL